VRRTQPVVIGSVLLLGFAASLAGTPVRSERTKLLAYRDGTGEHPVKTAAEWAKRQKQILAAMQKVMGPLPDGCVKVLLDPKYGEQVETPKYVRRKVSFAAGKDDRVKAYLLVPRGRTGKLPAVLCLHQTNGKLGGREPAGLGGRANQHYAAELAERGYITLAPDYPSFGESSYDFARSPFASGSMKAVWNNTLALDLL
jgi:acetyl esterase/lipase